MIVRIKYDFDRPNRIEVTNGLATLACIIAAIVTLVERLYHADFALAIIGTTILSTASLIPFFIFYTIHKFLII